MELDEFRSILKNSSMDLWTFIDTGISVAILDHENELRSRRGAIVEKLYNPLLCKNCTSITNYEIPESLTCKSIEGIDDIKSKAEEKSVQYEDVETKILRIKKLLENQNQSENSLVELLQSLADMDISFKVLERTDVGRHVNRLRKHSSNEVRGLVKLLIRRWKDTVDEWVRLNTPVEETGDADSPFEPHLMNNFKERADLYGNSSYGSPSCCGHKQGVENNSIGPSSKRLREDYLAVHHAKMQRTITRELDFHDAYKIKNSVVSNSPTGF